MKLAIVGSRTFNDYDVLSTWADSIFYMQSCDSKTVISGGANGADALAKKYAEKRKIAYIEFPADWENFGRRAGFRRNHFIVNACDMVLAFWDGESKGTAHTIELAKLQKKPTLIVYF